MFDTLLEISLTTSLIIALLLIFMPFLSKRYSSKWRYLIWLFVVIRLLIPINLKLPQSPLTLSATNGQIEMQLSAIIPDTIVVVPTNNISLIGEQPSIPTQDILLVIWAIGAIAFLFWHLSAHIIFCRSARRFGKQVDSETQKVFNSIKSELKIKKNIKVILYKEVSSPIMLGFFSSCVLLPNTDFNKADLEAIFTHELIHCSRRDLWYKLMILLAQSVHWFNPLVHMMAYAANRDIEISCDEEVIKNTDAAFRRQYAESMLSVMRKNLQPKTMLSTNFYGGKKVMKQRFTSIFDMKVKKKGIMLFAIVLVATLMAGMLVSCATVEDSTNTPASLSSENQTTKNTTTQEEPNTQTGTTGSNTSPAIKTGSGSYVGQADNNSIEIRISGVQDDKLAFRVFKISDEVRPTFESLSLKKDDEVKFSYYEQAIGQPVLTKIERISK